MLLVHADEKCWPKGAFINDVTQVGRWGPGGWGAHSGSNLDFLGNSVKFLTYLATTLNTETVIERKAICERLTALESAMEGQASAPLPPSRFMYMTASPRKKRLNFILLR